MRYLFYTALISILLGCSEGSGEQDINTISPLGENIETPEVLEKCIPNAIVGTYFSNSSSSDVSIDGDTLVLAYSNGIDIIDITDKSSPQFKGTMQLNSSINKAKIKGDLVFTYLSDQASPSQQLNVINIANIDNPSIVSNIDYFIIFQDIFIESNYIHFGADLNESKGRYYIYDFSDPFELTQSSAIDLSAIGDPGVFNLSLGSFVKEDNLLYAQSYFEGSSTGLYLLDISDREAPIEVNSTISDKRYLTHSSSTLYAGGDDQLDIYDINSAPIIKSLGSSADKVSDYYSIALVGDTLYSFGKLTGEISLTDVSNRAAPKLQDEKIYVHESSAMVSDSRYLYVADGAGLKIIDTCIK